MLPLLVAIKQNKHTTNITKNNTPNKRDALKGNVVNNTVRCYDRKNARTTDNGATIKEDMRLTRSLQQIGEDKLYV
jgi:hypothetical protein